MAHADSYSRAVRLELLGDFSDEDMPHVLALKDRVQETLGSLSCEERTRILGLYEWFERDDTTGSVRKSYRISPNRALIAELRRDSLGRLAAPELILQAVIMRGAKTDEGSLIKAVTEPWLEIVKWMLRDPTIIYQIRPRKWEEIIAGAYKKAGFDEVILTPASGDRGRDIIATKYGLGGVRVIDPSEGFQAWAPRHRERRPSANGCAARGWRLEGFCDDYVGLRCQVADGSSDRATDTIAVGVDRQRAARAETQRAGNQQAHYLMRP
jgi:hypothetical protein